MNPILRMYRNLMSDVNFFFLFGWPFVSRENERVRKWEPGEETGRAAGTVVVLLGSEGDTEIELESSPEGVICGRKVRESNPLTQRQSSFAAWSNTHSQGDTKSTRRGGTKEEIPPWQTTRAQHELAVSWFNPGCVLLQGHTRLSKSYISSNYNKFDR